MFVDIYAIQTVPPSNINRDDTGSPKTAWYGGVQRARVSSQAWKRAMRVMFPELLPEGTLGVRTKLAQGLVADTIAAARPDLADRAGEAARAVLAALGLKLEKSDRAGSEEGSDVTQYLVFIARSEIEGLAHVAIGWLDEGRDLAKPSKKEKNEAGAVFHGNQAVDIALFGRMLADAPDLNTDASAQVAHAISVDRVVQEYDYFTAVDDCAAEDNAGAAMIETVGFNSSTLYRYATVNVDALCEQLGDAEAAARGVAAFVDAFARAMPTGKQNTFANRTLPSALLVAVREGQPVNAVSAFEDPVVPRTGTSIARQAAERLGATLKSIDGAFGVGPVRAWNVVIGEAVESLDELSEHVDLGTLVEGVCDTVRELLEQGRE